MHPKTIIAGALAVGSFASATDLSGTNAAGLQPRHGPDGEEKSHIVARHGPDGDDEPHSTRKPSATKVVPRAPIALATTTDPAVPISIPSYDPIKISKLQSDMHNLHTKIRADPLYTSMTRALKTAIPESYRQAMLTNPASVHSEYHTAPPEWYRKLPGDIRGFMEKNQKDAKSIWSKDMGPVPTAKSGGATGDDKKKTDGAAKLDGQKSDAPGLSLVGAAVAALVGAFGVAALLL